METGTINISKITVIFGPNNSGKSIVSRLIHAILLLEPHRYKKQFFADSQDKADGLLARQILRVLDLSHRMVPTRGKPSSIIIIKDKENTHTLKIPKEAIGFMGLLTPPHAPDAKQQTKPSLYIPAGRTGTMEIFYTIMQLQNRLLGILTSAGKSESMDGNLLLSLTQKLLGTARLDAIMQDFYDMVLDAYSNGSTEYLQDRFYTMFSGHVHIEKQGHTMVEDAHGFRIPLENTGSGVISSIPILLGIDHVKEGGSLIIEEPEAHMEPAKQFVMMEEIWRASETKSLNLILTTHSDYVLKKLLSMVSQGKIKPSELGLYYFKRDKGQYTKILEMPVDETGEAEQPLFQDALDTMIKEFSK